jgi:hypothetical protein
MPPESLYCGYCGTKLLSPRTINMAGKTRGNLTVLHPVGRKDRYITWLCKCACGKQKVISGKTLRNPQPTKSCGECRPEKKRKFIDMLGQNFGCLTAIEFAGNHKNGAALWRCECDCGNEKIVSGVNLRRKNTTSCGCSRKKR